jgi:hypothetical protein
MCMNGFSDYLYTRPETKSNYSATPNLHNSQITIAPSKPSLACSVFTRRSLAKTSNGENSSASLAQALSSKSPMQKSLTTDFVPCL